MTKVEPAITEPSPMTVSPPSTLAGSKEEVIFTYPGLYAIYVYRIAHVLYEPVISPLIAVRLGKRRPGFVKKISSAS